VLHRAVDGGLSGTREARRSTLVQVHATVLASELRRRKVGSRSVTTALETVNRSTYILGELREAPTSLLVLAALSLTNGVSASGSRHGCDPHR